MWYLVASDLLVFSRMNWPQCMLFSSCVFLHFTFTNVLCEHKNSCFSNDWPGSRRICQTCVSSLFIGRCDVTESIATTRSPFCGRGIICGVKGRRFIVFFKQNSIRWFTKMSLWSLTCQQNVLKRYHSSKHLWEFYPQDGGENRLKPSFSANPFHCSLSFPSSGLTTWFPRLLRLPLA